MTITQYLGTGTLSRGRMTITKQLNTVVSTPPYLRDSHDREAVVMGLNSLRNSLKGVSNLGWISPRQDAATDQFVDSVSESPHARSTYQSLCRRMRLTW
jgi:cellobiose dehydrogenase (acceptor)